MLNQCIPLDASFEQVFLLAIRALCTIQAMVCSFFFPLLKNPFKKSVQDPPLCNYRKKRIGGNISKSLNYSQLFSSNQTHHYIERINIQQVFTSARQLKSHLKLLSTFRGDSVQYNEFECVVNTRFNLFTWRPLTIELQLEHWSLYKKAIRR